MSDAVAAQLEARLEGVAEDARMGLEGWVAARRRLVGQLTMRLGQLSTELAAAERRFREAIGDTPARGPEDAWRSFAWLRDFDRERARVEAEVWDLVRQADREQREFAAELAKQTRVLADAPRAVADALQVAIEELAQGGAQLGATPFGRDLGEALRERLALTRTAAERALAKAEAEIGRALARGVVDWELVSQRFESGAADRLIGGTAPAPSAARPARAPRTPPKPPRKRAKIPKFLISGFYKKGNLRAIGGDTEIIFVNPLAFCIVQNGDPILIDGRPHPTEATILDNGQKRISGDLLSAANYLKYPKGGALKVTLSGHTLSPGPHRITLSLELRKMGWVDINVTDEAQ